MLCDVVTFCSTPPPPLVTLCDALAYSPLPLKELELSLAELSPCYYYDPHHLPGFKMRWAMMNYADTASGT